MKKRKVIVVGGGTGGLMAAGQAALAGAEVILLEKKRKLGLKLTISGKKRCNVTNINDIDTFVAHFGKNGNFLRQAFARFFNTEIIQFFDNLGMETLSERQGRVFPKSGKATDVVDTLTKWVRQVGVEVRSATPVKKLLIEDGAVKGVVTQEETLLADAVILAVGGASYPGTGSSGDGYAWAESAGHKIVPVRPALVPLITKGDTSQAAGLDLKNIKVDIYIGGKKKKEDFGELGFNRTGIGGAVILRQSGFIVDAINKGKTAAVVLDLKPALEPAKLDRRIAKLIEERKKESISSVLRSLLPKELISVCLELCEISSEKIAETVGLKEQKRIRCWLKEFRMEITGYRALTEAIVTAGGVSLREIDPITFASKKAENLFLIGEVLDLHAETGGFNIQAAFTGGYLSGRCAALGPEVNQDIPSI